MASKIGSRKLKGKHKQSGGEVDRRRKCSSVIDCSQVARVGPLARSVGPFVGGLVITNIADFLRSTPSDLLRRYFDKIGLALWPSLAWAEKQPKLGANLQRMVEAAEEPDRQQVMDDADRIGVMADDAGQAALFAVAQDVEALEEAPNGYARAVWMLLHAPAAFEHAEQVRYADHRRHGRMWDAFTSQPGCTVAREGEKLETFKKAIKNHFGSRNVEVEICDRFRPKLEQDDSRLVQAAIYREGRSGARKAFVKGRLNRLLDHPVIEAAISYESDTGVIEVVAKEREVREEYVRLFAEHLLSTPFQGERMKVRQYTLEGLRKPFGFPTDPFDDIEVVRLSLLRLTPLDTNGERVTLESMRGAQRDIWQMAHSRFHDHDPLQDGYRVTQARFNIKFRPISGARRGRILPVTISMPQGCDLKDRTNQERVIGDKYLRRWNLLRDV